MLLALLLHHVRQPSLRAAPPHYRAATVCADTVKTVLNLIACRISADGVAGLTETEKLIWNTAVVIALMTGDSSIGVPSGAKISSWGAASAGFRAMGFPKLAECVRLFVLELAYRADLDERDKAADSASLVRVAELKHSFSATGAEVDFGIELANMIAKLHRKQ